MAFRIGCSASYLCDVEHGFRRANEEVMIGYEVEQRFYEIGSPEGLAETRAYFEAREGEGADVPR